MIIIDEFYLIIIFLVCLFLWFIYKVICWLTEKPTVNTESFEGRVIWINLDVRDINSPEKGFYHICEIRNYNIYGSQADNPAFTLDFYGKKWNDKTKTWENLENYYTDYQRTPLAKRNVYFVYEFEQLMNIGGSDNG